MSAELKAAHREVPWRDVVLMRNVVAHGYDQVKLDVVWRVTKDDLPALRLQIASLAQEID